LKDEISGSPEDAEVMGITLADRLLEAGADKILAKVYAE
jgi:hydroxymethylbilane synthase